MTTSIRGAGGKIIIVNTIWSEKNHRKNSQNKEIEHGGDQKIVKSTESRRYTTVTRSISQQLTTTNNRPSTLRCLFYTKNLLK